MSFRQFQRAEPRCKGTTTAGTHCRKKTNSSDGYCCDAHRPKTHSNLRVGTLDTLLRTFDDEKIELNRIIEQFSELKNDIYANITFFIDENWKITENPQENGQSIVSNVLYYVALLGNAKLVRYLLTFFKKMKRPGNVYETKGQKFPEDALSDEINTILSRY